MVAAAHLMSGVGALPPGSFGSRSVVSLTSFLLKLGSKSAAMPPTAEV